MMNLAFAGFRHSHILTLYQMAQAHEGVNIVGCYEEDAAAKAANTDVAFTYTSYEALLADASVEAVAIGDYYAKRGHMVIAALKAGKHVICDKPICTRLDELEEIEALVKKTGLQVCCMLDLRYMAQIPTVQQLLSDGAIGAVVNVAFTGQHCLDYGNRPGWYFEEGKHGGTINDIAIHGVDLVRMLTKKNLTKVNFAKTRNVYATAEPQFEDCGQFVAELDGISLMADVSYAAPKCATMLPTYWDFYLWGTKGMLKFNLATNELRLYTTEEQVISCAPRTPDYLNAFLAEIGGEKTMMNTLDILQSQRQVLEIQRAAER